MRAQVQDKGDAEAYMSEVNIKVSNWSWGAPGDAPVQQEAAGGERLLFPYVHRNGENELTVGI